MTSSSEYSGDVNCTADISPKSILAMHGLNIPDPISTATDHDDDNGLKLLNHCLLTDEQIFCNQYSAEVKNSLTILNINLRSANSNFFTLTCFLSQLKITIKNYYYN